MTVRRSDGEATLTWSVVPLPDGTPPTLLTITINSKDDPAPPATTNHAIDAPAGTLELPSLDPGKRYDLFISDATADGRASESVRRDLPALA